MKDKPFIESMVEKAEQAKQKFQSQLTGLSLSQLNWKPEPASWTIGQCLDHLVVSDCAYFPSFKKIMDGTYRMNFWERWSPFSWFFGRLLVSQIQEQPRRKMNAPKKFKPTPLQIDSGIYERFSKHLGSLIEYIGLDKHVDLDKTRITSPVSKIITYNLRDNFPLLIQHEHRHLNQAIRIRKHKEFPTNN